SKWGLLSGLTLFLPHGYEGQGPEHSSGRIERFLQLAAHDNFQIVQPTTPAQMFHLLRRQVVRPYRKPLIVFTPKSLLRHPDASSSLGELASGAFRPLIDEVDALDPTQVTRLVFCSGRLYYDLLRARREREIHNIAIIRIEQIYPWPDLELAELLARYPNVNDIVWAQDEPLNQGAWRYAAYPIRLATGITLCYAGRPESSSPAAGYASLHKQQLEEILIAALGPASA
ncbi:MAG: 2-oxoglutarate dehydrogenase E1 component, partial [Gammaproteobacteria bacterium]|nr:2-oxoglutarate dehydrogenase E1 component [Gammaproteobacteria bacterium]